MITMNNGDVLKAETETNRGDWSDPYSVNELTKKYNSLTARAWEATNATKIYDTVMAIEDAASITPLSDLIHQAGHPLS
jgi:hypothetical protein